MEIKTSGNPGYMNLTTLHLWYPLFENAGKEHLSAALLTKISGTMTHTHKTKDICLCLQQVYCNCNH